MTARTFLAGTRRVLAWMVLLAVVAVIALAVVLPRATGARPYVVLTGSMRPQLPPGTLVVVRPVPTSELAAGRVVTYQLRSGEPEVVTHRIVALGYDGQGRRVFRTQGDANRAPDTAWVHPEQILGERWYSLPWVGHVSVLLEPDQRELVSKVIGWGLAGYALWAFVGVVRARRSHGSGVTA